MRHPEAKSYSPPFDLNAPLGTLAVGEVLKSDNPRFKAGDHVYGFLRMEEFQVVSKEGTAVLKVLENKEKLPWSTWVGAAGMPVSTRQ
jgi:NADPH-dependent curcumin reductase CurA